VREPIAVYVRKLSYSMSIHFVEIHSSADENRKKSLNSFSFFEVQGHTKSSMLIPFRKFSPCLFSPCLKFITNIRRLLWVCIVTRGDYLTGNRSNSL